MNKKMLIVIGGLLAALLVVGVVGATSAFAQGQTPPANGWTGNGHGPGGGHGFGLGTAELDAAAKVLGMTSDELSSALQSGKTLQDLADAAGVNITDVQAAIQAARVTEMRDRIQQAVTDGTITQANADWLLEGLDKGYIGTPGAFKLGGFGPDFGGPRGFGHGFGPNQAPAAQPTQSSGG